MVQLPATLIGHPPARRRRPVSAPVLSQYLGAGSALTWDYLSGDGQGTGPETASSLPRAL